MWPFTRRKPEEVLEELEAKLVRVQKGNYLLKREDNCQSIDEFEQKLKKKIAKLSRKAA